MPCKTLLLTLLTVFFGTFTLSVSAQRSEIDSIPSNCENVDAEYYRPNLILRYESDANRLLLLDWNTREEVVVLAEDLETAEIAPRGWSQNCRYLAVSTGAFRNTDLIIWDTVTGQQFNPLPDLYLYDVRWSPRHDEVLVETRSGAYLWRFQSNALVQLTDFFSCYGRSFTRNIHWDYARGQFIGVREDFSCRHEPGPVAIFNLATGTLVDEVRGSSFIFSDDNSLLISTNEFGRVEIYNRNNGTVTLLNVEPRPGRFYLSPDNRYLIVARRNIRVWDLTNQADQNTPIINFAGPNFNVSDIRFLTSTTIETTDFYNTVQRWNILTGEELP
ncbi:MAG: WD40 repeat domain-containing protein [bacterium]|nr:WD40 repeat domain-containing protein [bacterium]